MCIYSCYIYMVCVCVCVLDSMNLFVSSDLSLKSFSNCLDPRLEIDSVWRCQTSHECKAMSAALVIPFFFVRLSLNQKEFYTNFLWQLNRPSNSSSLFTKLGSPVASSILLFFLIFVTFGLLSRSLST